MSYRDLQAKQTKLELHLQQRSLECEQWDQTKTKELAKRLQCCVCMDNVINELLGCGHFFCAQCALSIKVSENPFCPQCNSKITQAQAVYF
jgi:hypothetical protein